MQRVRVRRNSTRRYLLEEHLTNVAPIRSRVLDQRQQHAVLLQKLLRIAKDRLDLLVADNLLLSQRLQKHLQRRS